MCECLMYYVLGSHELVAPASAGAPPLPAQACTSQSHSRALTPLASFFLGKKSTRMHLPTPNKRLAGGAWKDSLRAGESLRSFFSKAPPRQRS